MLICTPCGAQAPDEAAACGACGEGSWRRFAAFMQAHAEQPKSATQEPVEELAPTQPEPVVESVAATGPVVEPAPAASPTLFAEPAPVQRPQHQGGKHRHR